MYSTCLFCNGSLGVNETLEHFPVGRRLAFDSASGRLWVVCTNCERWNLSPLESRWEANEEAERAFRGTRMRVSTDNVGLARMADGTELVRIGAPPQLEFAAWRYGTQFEKRHRKTMMIGAAMAPFAILPLVSMYTGVAAFATLGTTASLVYSVGMNYHFQKWKKIPSLSVRDDSGKLLRLTRIQATQSKILPSDKQGELRIEFAHAEPTPATGVFKWLGHSETAGPNVATTVLTGVLARRAASKIIAQVNAEGGSKRRVRSAIELINSSSSIDAMVRKSPRYGGTFSDHLRGTLGDDLRFMSGGAPVGRLPSVIRMAFEMSVHEHDERRAMEGELHELEARWRDADAIAKIADAMFLPDDIHDRVNALHERETNEKQAQ